MSVVHSWELSRENVGRSASQDEMRDAPPISHPLARVHPETGRTSLFMGMHASHIEGLSFAGRPGQDPRAGGACDEDRNSVTATIGAWAT